MPTQSELYGKCPYATAQKVLSGKWAVVVLQNLSRGTLRFGALQRALPHLTQATLTKQLRQLEQDGLVHREVYPEVPPRVEYSLTPIGRAFQPVLDSLGVWGEEYIGFLAAREGEA